MIDVLTTSTGYKVDPRSRSFKLPVIFIQGFNLFVKCSHEIRLQNCKIEKAECLTALWSSSNYRKRCCALLKPKIQLGPPLLIGHDRVNSTCVNAIYKATHDVSSNLRNPKRRNIKKKQTINIILNDWKQSYS